MAHVIHKQASVKYFSAQQRGLESLLNFERHTLQIFHHYTELSGARLFGSGL